MALPLKIDRSLRERRRIIRLLDFLKRDDLTSDQMERIGKRLQKSGRRALNPLVRKLWRENSGTAIYRYACMLDFFDDYKWLDQLVQITLKRTNIEEEGRLALLDALQDYGIDVTLPPFAGMTGYGSSSLEGFIEDCLKDGERGLVRFMDIFLDSADDVRERMIRKAGDNGTPEAVAMLGILLTFEREKVVSEVIRTLGRIKNGYALTVLLDAVDRHPADISALIKRSIRRLSFLGISEKMELPHSFPSSLPFYQVLVGPIDIYGSRSLWFSWKLEDESFGSLLLLSGENDGIINALSYRLKDEAEYNVVLGDVAAAEMLMPVDPGYALALLRDSLFQSRAQGFFLPPDFYVDRRLFTHDSLHPEAYLPRFKVEYLDGIVEKIPAFIAAGSELLDSPALEGWLLSEPAVYDAAEQLEKLAATEDGITESMLEAELALFCSQLIIPRRGELIKRLLLTADYMQQIDSNDSLIQQTLATALSLVGGFLPESRHPFIRRLILDSIETARQALADGYDPRLEGGFDDDDE
ncbi:MAG: hypothetical protein A2079_02155 [Geobacteraceae bacterium GWC2_48_7]|nr:MAG: hypothetical protein A2079_02155 [Geobacteraceae bacterium GWC2_48_7]